MPEQKKKTAGTSARKTNGKNSANNKSRASTRRSTQKTSVAASDTVKISDTTKKRQRSGKQSSANKTGTSRKKRSQRSREQEVKRLKILIVAVTTVVLIVGILLIHRLLFPINKGSLTGVSDEVLKYQTSMEKACKDAGISQFSTVMLAMMQQESSGLGADVLQCSECPFNTEYDNSPNAITDPEYSIQVGAEYFAYCLKEAGCKSIKNTERLKIALQDYNFGNSYAAWVLENYGTYTVENATEFSLMMQNTLGWSSYGDPEYVEHVLRYYVAS